MNGSNAFQASNTKGSSTLKPEMTSEFEVGLNLQFFNGRLGIDASYYNRTTNDQIFTLPVDPSTGYSYMVTNFGKVRNSGVELVLNTVPIQTKDFRWNLDFNFAKNNNKVIALPESLEGGKVSIYSFSAGMMLSICMRKRASQWDSSILTCLNIQNPDNPLWMPTGSRYWGLRLKIPEKHEQ